MRPMTYTVDIQKIRSAFVPCVQGLLMGAVLVSLGITLDDLVRDSRDPLLLVSVIVGPVLIAVSIVAAIWIARRLPAAKNLLSIDNQGLTVMRRGRIKHWHWADISPVRRHGRAATFTAEADGRRSGERIDDIYPTPLDDIVARINDCRDRALAAGAPTPGTEAPGAPSTPSTPSMYYIDPETRKRKHRKEVLPIVALMTMFPIFYLFVAKEKLSQLFKDVNNEQIMNYFDIIDIYFGLFYLFMLFSILLMMFVVAGKVGNFIQATDEGLTWSQRGTMIRQWLWRDISSFELRDNSAAGSPGARTIAFMTADDGKVFRGMGMSSLFLGKQLPPGLLSFTMEDPYDTPADKMATQLNAYRERALADSPPSRTIALSAVDTVGSGRQPLGFQQDIQDVKRWGVVTWALMIGCFVWFPVVLWLGWPFDIPGGTEGPAVSVSQWALRFLSMLPVIAIIAELLFLIRETMPADNMLRMDTDGLTLVRGGRQRHWPWRDLSAFKVEVRKILGLFGPRGVIVFDAPGGRDLRSRFLRLCYRLTGRTRAIVIEDVYSVPLDDIATALDRHTLGTGGGATA